MLHVSQDRHGEEEALQVRRMSRHHLLQRGVSEGGLQEAQVELPPRHGHRDPGEGSGAGGGEGHQDGRADLCGRAGDQSQL